MLSNKAKYGLKALLYLAEHGDGTPILIAEIAESEDISKKFLDAILLELRNAGLVGSKKGRGGGYFLAKPTDQIFIGTVIRVLDGPIAPIPCASRTAYRPCDDCGSVQECAIRGLMLDVRDAMAAILDSTTLAALHARGKAAQTLMYYI
ncbi:RrF2 family transcriptional regulator [Rhodospirillum rubrum]|uniref:Transcriptional regulator, BadM/Rrf2 family n=1 Tax=Rhodospirillum rubrum (strain ATCC 11170 / ATH 1.1.1 / DSM 467 / LMG 4362 / NCIMB 8255 / S1) TaxID=269796 RepID=Q2RV73_RHORT|nr:Rrf2 family transcriptional regulator [Rhodospirillum rubrum]ABC21972.1 transcriptional regulator, BadM/Rrf2 family [Rhodospirillum rubrum ATCC 11170]AEO47682.1 BadM/Rrf2 family transcriptional regulator [Rhodospirillum rubrum F11]MBK1666240.1 Rrf2 family transcriptional regulator [Rhodospirillum rubrum]MBK1678384.1 Rrf2 family transcriptional regulator [Rhodospirillum rubrum]MBK5953543.1 Rrf2 family transcriptional regulator [Rhodospirillum rubrum]